MSNQSRSHEAIPLIKTALEKRAVPPVAANFFLFLIAYSTLIGLGILGLAGISYVIGLALTP